MTNKITNRQIEKDIRKLRMRSIILLSLIFHLSLAIVYIFLHLNGVTDGEKDGFVGDVYDFTTKERIDIPKRPLDTLNFDRIQDFSGEPLQQLEDAKHRQAEVKEISSKVVIHDVENNTAPLHDNVPETMTDAKLRDAEASNLSHPVSLPGRTDGTGRITGDVRAPGDGIGSHRSNPWTNGPGGTGRPVFDPGNPTIPIIIDFPLDNAGKTDVIYCLDISASMQAAGLNKLDLAVQAIKDSILGLGKDDTFNIVTFSTEIRTMSKEMLTANADNIRQTLQYLDDFTPESIQDNRGTNILTALEAALMFDSSAIVLVTDGLPHTIEEHNIETDTQTILDAVREKNLNGTNIYVVALEIDLKRSVGAQLLISLTQENNGQLKVLDTETIRNYSR